MKRKEEKRELVTFIFFIVIIKYESFCVCVCDFLSFSIVEIKFVQKATIDTRVQFLNEIKTDAKLKAFLKVLAIFLSKRFTIVEFNACTFAHSQSHAYTNRTGQIVCIQTE